MYTPRFIAAGHWKKNLAIFGFLGLLWLPTVGGFFHWDKSTGVDEKRALVAFPNFPDAVTGMRPYISKIEAWYDDHFGFRKWLIYEEQNWKRRWFGESRSYSVLIGQKGWLFYTPGEMLNALPDDALFSRQQLDDWCSLLEGRRDWLASRGILYVFVLVPKKQTIYSEFLPEWRNKPHSTTKLDQFVAYMRTNSTVAVVDLRPALLDAKIKGQVYLQTDSHWNQYGAFVACEEVIKNLAIQKPGLRPLKLQDFDESFSMENSGDLARMLAATESMKEKGYVHLLPRAPLKNLNCASTERSSGRIEVVENPEQKGSALIFGDSFAGWWFPFIGYHFRKVTFVRLYDYLDSTINVPGGTAHCWKTSIIEQEKPTVLIDEIEEQYFDNEDPNYIKKLDGLK